MQQSQTEILLRLARTGSTTAFVNLVQSQDNAHGADHCVDLDVSDGCGWSPLSHASFNGHAEIVCYIIDYQKNRLIKIHAGKRSEHKDFCSVIGTHFTKDSNTHPAKQNDKIDSSIGNDELSGQDSDDESRLLLWECEFAKFVTHKVNWNGSSPLHLACSRGHKDTISLLICSMVELRMPVQLSVSLSDFDMATPLHCSVLGQRYEACELLLQHGAVVVLKDIRGKTPLDWAEERQLTQMAALLRQYKQKNKIDASLNRIVMTQQLDEAQQDQRTADIIESIWEIEEQKSMESSFNSSLTVHQNQQQQQFYLNPQSSQQHDDCHSIPLQTVRAFGERGPARQMHRHVDQQYDPRYHHQQQQQHAHMSHGNTYNTYRRPSAPRHQTPVVIDEVDHVLGSNDPPLPVSVATPEQTAEVESKNSNEVDAGKRDVSVNRDDVDNNPDLDAIKFENRYLRSRCCSLKNEQGKLTSEYRQQLSRERKRWKLQQEQLQREVVAKQKQVHEMRHSMRKLRGFLDNLPLRLKRTFYSKTTSSGYAPSNEESLEEINRLVEETAISKGTGKIFNLKENNSLVREEAVN